MTRPTDRTSCFFHMPESVKGLREECQETGLVFVFPEALFFFPLLLFSSSLSPRQLVAAGGEALGDLEGATQYSKCCKTTENDQNLFQQKMRGGRKESGMHRSCSDQMLVGEGAIHTNRSKLDCNSDF